ncbi:MAG TPA: hypothetical protein VF727_08740 [Allosphingosinicella sp.]|jgi:hypothetical protein
MSTDTRSSAEPSAEARPRKLRVAVIVDGDRLPRFARDAIDAVQGCDEITVLSCMNTRFKRRPARHALYYALNLVSVRNAWTRAVPIASSRKRIARTIRFQSTYGGAWQSLPEAIVAELAQGGFDVILKFGMGLMRVPPPEALPVPILSYHHGDPDWYRGRPAGFWEMVEGTPVMGQIVQILSNRLDAGEVVAFAETRVLPHSYRATLIEAYRHSPLLIDQAISRAVSGVPLAKRRDGRNYRLPSNAQVLSFVLKMAAALVRRVGYAAFFEQRWKVSLAHIAEGELQGLLDTLHLPEPARWHTLPIAPRYIYYADPFFSPHSRGVLVEAANRWTGLGEIVHAEGEKQSRLSRERRHFSYPASVETPAGALIVPEIAEWSTPRAYRLQDGAMTEALPLRIEAGARVVDPTILEADGRFYLFGSPLDVGSTTLCLWCADSLDGPFRAHPMNPLRISPRGSRMAGGIVRVGDRLFRFGQNYARSYGDGIHVFEITELSPERFAERHLGEISLGDPKGPHTLNVRAGEIVFDWYRERFSPLAGVRRAIARLRRRR